MSEPGLDSKSFAFFDAKKHVQDMFGDGFSVLSECVVNINSSRIGDSKITVVIHQMRGPIYDDCQQIPLQVDFYISQIEQLDVVNQAVALANRVVTAYTGYRVSQTYTSPSLMEKSDEFGSGGLARYSCVAYFFIYSNAADIESIKVNGEEIDFLQCTVAYQSEGPSAKNRGTYLMGSDPTGGTTTVVLKMVAKRNGLFQSLLYVRNGSAVPNSHFAVTLKYPAVDGYSAIEELHTMVAAMISDSHVKAGQLPSLDVTFTEAKD